MLSVITVYFISFINTLTHLKLMFAAVLSRFHHCCALTVSESTRLLHARVGGATWTAQENSGRGYKEKLGGVGIRSAQERHGSRVMLTPPEIYGAGPGGWLQRTMGAGPILQHELKGIQREKYLGGVEEV